jgi:hypothetical protein
VQFSCAGLDAGTPEIAMQSADVVIEGEVSFTASIDLVNSFFFSAFGNLLLLSDVWSPKGFVG